MKLIIMTGNEEVTRKYASLSKLIILWKSATIEFLATSAGTINYQKCHER